MTAPPRDWVRVYVDWRVQRNPVLEPHAARLAERIRRCAGGRGIPLEQGSRLRAIAREVCARALDRELELLAPEPSDPHLGYWRRRFEREMSAKVGRPVRLGDERVRELMRSSTPDRGLHG